MVTQSKYPTGTALQVNFTNIKTDDFLNIAWQAICVNNLRQFDDGCKILTVCSFFDFLCKSTTKGCMVVLLSAFTRPQSQLYGCFVVSLHETTITPNISKRRKCGTHSIPTFTHSDLPRNRELKLQQHKTQRYKTINPLPLPTPQTVKDVSYQTPVLYVSSTLSGVYRLTSHGNNSFFFWKKILKSLRSIYICPRPLSETVCQQTGKRMLVKPRYKGCFKNSCLAVSCLIKI